MPRMWDLASATRSASERVRCVPGLGTRCYSGCAGHAGTQKGERVSVRVVAAVLNHFPEGGTRKLALICLADFADDSGGTCYPSMRTIARRCSCSEAQARRHVHALMNSGHVAVESGTGGGGRGKTPRYRINIAKLNPSADDSLSDVKGSAQGTLSGINPRIHARKTLASTHVNPCTHASRSINNHQVTISATQRFERFWIAYPKKRDKPKALKAWEKLKPDADLTERILETIDLWKSADEWQRDGGKFIPHPATWLAGRRWEDELQPGAQRERKVAL